MKFIAFKFISYYAESNWCKQRCVVCSTLASCMVQYWTSIPLQRSTCTTSVDFLISSSNLKSQAGQKSYLTNSFTFNLIFPNPAYRNSEADRMILWFSIPILYIENKNNYRIFEVLINGQHPLVVNISSITGDPVVIWISYQERISLITFDILSALLGFDSLKVS